MTDDDLNLGFNREVVIGSIIHNRNVCPLLLLKTHYLDLRICYGNVVDLIQRTKFLIFLLI